jgi:hypothetical protein
MPEGPEDVAHRRRRIVGAKHGHIGKRLERAIVPFRVQHDHRVALQNELLAQEAGQP